jgi:hypothetical protein
MKRFLNNAREQFQQFQQVVIHYYPDRTYQNPERYVYMSLEDAENLIQEICTNQQEDDIHVPAPEWFDDVNVPKPESIHPYGSRYLFTRS